MPGHICSGAKGSIADPIVLAELWVGAKLVCTGEPVWQSFRPAGIYGEVPVGADQA